jgi:hypothetical protein
VAESDGTLEAIVAHGLIGSLAVATGAASMLLKARRPFDPETEAWLITSISEQSTLVLDGMRTIMGSATPSYVDAATNVALAAGTIAGIDADRRAPVLEVLLRSSDVLRSTLGALVRGLPPEVVEMLDELNASHQVQARESGPAIA